MSTPKVFLYPGLPWDLQVSFFKATSAQLSCMGVCPHLLQGLQGGPAASGVVPRRAFLLLAWEPPTVKTPSERTEERGRVTARRPHCCLQLDCSPWMWSSVALEVTSMLSAGAFSREGFPERLIIGVVQSLQLSSAETFVVEIF